MESRNRGSALQRLGPTGDQVVRNTKIIQVEQAYDLIQVEVSNGGLGSSPRQKSLS